MIMYTYFQGMRCPFFMKMYDLSSVWQAVLCASGDDERLRGKWDIT